MVHQGQASQDAVFFPVQSLLHLCRTSPVKNWTHTREARLSLNTSFSQSIQITFEIIIHKLLYLSSFIL